MLKLHHKITAGCLVCFFLLWSVRIPLTVHAAESSYGAYVYDGSSDSFSGEQQITAQMLYKLTKAEFDQYDFAYILSHLPSSGSGFTNYLLFCSSSTLSLAYFPDGVFCVFDDNFSAESRSSYASRSGLSSISNYGVSLYDYIQDNNSPTSFELYTCNLSNGQWGSAQSLGMYYTNLGTQEHYNYYSAGKKTLIGGSCPVYSVAEAANYDTTISQSNQFVPLIVENMDSLTNYNSGSIAVYNGESMVVPEPEVSFESIDNHLFAKTFDVGFCMNPNVWNGNINLQQGNFGNFYFKYSLDNYASVNVSDLSLHVASRVVSPEGTFTDDYSFSLDGDGFMTFGNNFIVSDYSWLLDPSLFTIIYDYEIAEGFKRMEFVSGLTVEHLQRSYLRYVGQGRARVCYNSSGEYIGAVTDYPTDLVTYPDDFNVTFDCYITSKSTGESSQHFIKTFDFVRGTSSVSDSGIFDNVNPFDGTPDMNEIIPFDGGSGLSGAGNVIQQVSFPSRIEFVNESYIKVAELYSQDAQTVQNGFWAMMGYFAENPMIDTYSDMFDWMPPELLGYIGTCLGICFGFGVFRAIRGRG